MSFNIPTLLYELNTMVRKHREAKGYTQEEFAFLIGKEYQEIKVNEDLTSSSSYDINHANFYARVLEKKPANMFFTNSFEEAYIKITAKKSINKKGVVSYKGTGSFNKKVFEIEPYHLLEQPVYNVTLNDQNSVLEILEDWLKNDYFKGGVTGYTIFQDLLTQNNSGEITLPKSFRPILVIRALKTLCGKRKKPKLLPQRKLPKTEEKWLLYKEDV